jgi:uncharacterized membrane protein YdjX (TVP38/TMEM64 family)
MDIKMIRRWLPLLILISLLLLFFSLHLNRYVNFEVLKYYSTSLIAWTKAHWLEASGLFILGYTIAVAASFPGAVFLTLTSGYLFGIVWGVVLVVIGATLGSMLLFLAIRTALAEWLAARASSWVDRMRQGFQQDAFSYLLTLRLIPIFPFWVVNIVPALLNVPAKTFFSATLLGIIPGTTVYVALGNGLNQLFAENQMPNMRIILTPKVFFPLLALALLSLLPVLYRQIKRKRKGAS